MGERFEERLIVHKEFDILVEVLSEKEVPIEMPDDFFRVVHDIEESVHEGFLSDVGGLEVEEEFAQDYHSVA